MAKKKSPTIKKSLSGVTIKSTPTGRGKYIVEWEKNNPYQPYKSDNAYLKKFKPERIKALEESNRKEWERKRDNYADIKFKAEQEKTKRKSSTYVSGVKRTPKQTNKMVDQLANTQVQRANRSAFDKINEVAVETTLALAPEIAALKWAKAAKPFVTNLKSSDEITKLWHFSNNKNLKYIDIDPLRVGKSQTKKRYAKLGYDNLPSGFYTHKNKYANFMGGNTGYELTLQGKLNVKDLVKEGRVTDRIPRKELKKYIDEGYDIIKGKNMIGGDETILLNKNKVINFENIGDRSNIVKNKPKMSLGGKIPKFKKGGKTPKKDNILEGDLISKVLMNRNRNLNFVDRAYNPENYTPQKNPDGTTSTHIMAWGEDDKGQAHMFPTMDYNMDENGRPIESIKVPNQYADYISRIGYKNATGMNKKEFSYGGSILSGAGSMAGIGMTIGGPVGAAIGGLAGGAMGFFKERATKQAELEAQRLQSEQIAKQQGQMNMQADRSILSSFPTNGVNQSYFAKGGKIENEPTRSDSLALLNNSKEIRNYYSDTNNYKEKDNPNKEFILSRYLNVLDYAKNDYFPDISNTSYNLPKVQKDDYYKNINDNQFKQRDISNAIVDGRSPMQLYDRRIPPTNLLTLKNSKNTDTFAGDIIEIFDYPELQVSPQDLLTDDQIKERVKLYGNSGIPNSRLAKLNLPIREATNDPTLKNSEYQQEAVEDGFVVPKPTRKQVANLSKINSKGIGSIPNPITAKMPSKLSNTKLAKPANKSKLSGINNGYYDNRRLNPNQWGTLTDEQGNVSNLTYEELDAMSEQGRKDFFNSFDNQGFYADRYYNKNKRKKMALGGDLSILQPKGIAGGNLQPISNGMSKVQGNSHAQGGVNMMANGRPIEVEGGEVIDEQGNYVYSDKLYLDDNEVEQFMQLINM